MEVERMRDPQEGEEKANRMCSTWHKLRRPLMVRLHNSSSGGMFLLAFALVCTLVLPSRSDYAKEPVTMGVNYGKVSNNLPSDADAVSLIKSLGAGQVKIYNTDSGTLTALANTGLDVVIAVDNSLISSLAASASTADQWVVTNVVAYYPSTSITVILVGNELFSTAPQFLPQLVPAIQNLQTSLTKHGLTSVALSTACELSILSSSYPPSAGIFAPGAVSMLTPLLEYLDNTSSYLYINAYPYFAWASDPSGIPLDYAVFSAASALLTDGQYSYTNLLEAQLDAVYYAMEALGYKDVRIALSESGWPTAGGAGANASNAEAYNNNLVKFILGGAGTPKRPRMFVPTYVFALFNEDLKPGAATEQHWGLLYPNGSTVYSISLAASSSPGGTPSGGSSSSGGGGTGSNSNSPSSPDICGDRASVLPLSITFLGMLFNLRI